MLITIWQRFIIRVILFIIQCKFEKRSIHTLKLHKKKKKAKKRLPRVVKDKAKTLSLTCMSCHSDVLMGDRLVFITAKSLRFFVSLLNRLKE